MDMKKLVKLASNFTYLNRSWTILSWRVERRTVLDMALLQKESSSSSMCLEVRRRFQRVPLDFVSESHKQVCFQVSERLKQYGNS